MGDRITVDQVIEAYEKTHRLPCRNLTVADDRHCCGLAAVALARDVVDEEYLEESDDPASLIADALSELGVPYIHGFMSGFDSGPDDSCSWPSRRLLEGWTDGRAAALEAFAYFQGVKG